MRTAGIDLATEAKSTAVCVIDWLPGETRVRYCDDRSDQGLEAACRTADTVGIDCPFGWPEPFINAIDAHRSGGAWPGRGKLSATFRRSLAYRQTDLHVHRQTGYLPLAVAADRISLTAMRCALLLDAVGGVDRSGQTGRVAEVYPAATLRCWRFPKLPYKGTKNKQGLVALVDHLAKLADYLQPDVLAECEQSDHTFDALICALTARAVMLGRTQLPDDQQEPRAYTEGWIHLPTVPPNELLER